ncbi:NAD-dependent epimerase/dehydratase family protein [Nocardioides sp. TRM66260-LWL]|uniref:NAD-dependent epimerase/dehydratase family protein n=1 Tax=Nocardioides sp. TRM66260-LWL TaxID=2874478 RepID=UPI001CC54046|nr:NAD-dependent epimerase/dehydratase family protein [Nocardioides sp. TRM66260-LWL]MBZ5735523.1 NAD-dependent epimerase/dehydratase family protein [Nocardioides sp. TRM66260-LWL]
MRVLLTGSAGFIGTAVRARLEAAGHDVVGVDLMLEQAHGDAAAPAGTHRLDVRDAVADPDAAWSRLLRGVDVVCHQAGVVGVERDAAELPLYASHNDVGTATLLAAMAAHGVERLVLASSMVVYGEGRYACATHGPQTPGPRSEERMAAGRYENACPRCDEDLAWLTIGEDAPLRPRSGYAAGKAAQEHYAGAWARLTGSRLMALRYHNVYGPGMPRDSSYCGVAAIFRSRIEAGLPPLVLEDGGQQRDFVHVDDVATANLLAIEAVGDLPAGDAPAYNVASGQPVTIAQVAEAIAGTRGLTPEVVGGHRIGDVRHVVASPEAARRDLGFVAAVRPEAGLPALASAPLREAVR